MFACIFIPDFSAQALIRFEPELRTRPLAVLAGRPPLEKVVALNERARQSGVEVGATKSQLEAWENLVLRARSEAQETSAHAALLDCAQSFSPEVEDTSPGTVLLNLAGLEPLLGPLPKIARDLAQRISQMGLEANCRGRESRCCFARARGFSGVTLIPEGREAEPTRRSAGRCVAGKFFFRIRKRPRAGWKRLIAGAFASCAHWPLFLKFRSASAWDSRGSVCKSWRGARPSRNLRVLEPQLIFAESVELEYPIVLLEPLAFLLNRMLEQVCARLRARALAVQELHLNLELATTQPNDLRVGAERSQPSARSPARCGCPRPCWTRKCSSNCCSSICRRIRRERPS
jgi:protein ImuB